MALRFHRVLPHPRLPHHGGRLPLPPSRRPTGDAAPGGDGGDNQHPRAPGAGPGTHLHRPLRPGLLPRPPLRGPGHHPPQGQGSPLLLPPRQGRATQQPPSLRHHRRGLPQALGWGTGGQKTKKITFSPPKKSTLSHPRVRLLHKGDELPPFCR